MAREPKQPDTDAALATRESVATRDIGLGNTYRIEYIKNLVSIATGVVVFTVTFMKDLVGKPLSEVFYKPLLIAGWSVLVLSIIAGIFHMRFWAAYYISWGLHPSDAGGSARRAHINKRRLFAEYTQIFSFLIGLVLLVIFASVNMTRKIPSAGPQAAQTLICSPDKK